MHATVCLLRAGQPRRVGNLAKSGQIIGQFLLITGGDPIGVKGLINIVLLIIILCSYLYVV